MAKKSVVPATSSGISFDAWTVALEQAGVSMVDDQTAITVGEFAEQFDLTILTASRRLKNLVRLGKARRTTKRMVDSNGRMRSFIAFALVP